MEGFNCLDCNIDTGEIDEYYMVHNHLWMHVNHGQHDGMLCIGCLEKRLGRTLTKVDFPNIPINWPNVFFTHSERLVNRLTTN